MEAEYEDMKVYVNSTYIEEIDPRDVHIDDYVSQASVASIKWNSDEFTEYPKGTPVLILDEDGTKLFDGFVDIPKRTTKNMLNKYELHCIDKHYLLRKRTVTYEGRNVNTATVVSAVASLLSDEGITTGTITNGKTMEEVKLAKANAEEAIKALAEADGYFFALDYDSKIQYRPYTAIQSGITITADDLDNDIISLNEQNHLYVNRYHVSGGWLPTDKRHHYFLDPLGSMVNFDLDYAVANKPVIKVNDVVVNESLIGLKGQNGYEWYFAYGDRRITKATALSAGDMVDIEYIGQYRPEATAENSAAIAAQAAIDGTSGIVEDAYISTNNTSVTDINSIANSRLARYGVKAKLYQFSTGVSGIEAGVIITIDSPEHGMNEVQLFVDNVHISFDGDGEPTYGITAVAGAVSGDWTLFFEGLAGDRSSLTRISLPDVGTPLMNYFTPTAAGGEGKLPPTAGDYDLMVGSNGLWNILTCPNQVGTCLKVGATGLEWGFYSLADITGPATHMDMLVFSTSGGEPHWGAIPVGVAGDVLGVIGTAGGPAIGWTSRNHVFPSQSGKENYVLSTNGTDIYWANILTHILPYAEVGDILIGNGTHTWSILDAPSTSGLVLTSGGSGNPPTWATPTGGSFPTQTGNQGKVLSTNGTSPFWANILTQVLPYAEAGELLVGNGTHTWSILPAPSAAGKVLTSGGAGNQPTWASLPASASGAIAGTVTAVNGNTATVLGENGITYTARIIQ
jgi:hypothetical protein